MLELFSQLLKDYLAQQEVSPVGHITFGPPNQAYVLGLPQGASVNIYLTDVRENRKLRTNERFHENPAPGGKGLIRESSYPAWVDAHYLISAWDSAKDPSIQAINEQKILRAISASLLAGDPFTPSVVYADPAEAELQALAAVVGAAAAEAAVAAFIANRRSLLNAWPPELREPGLFYTVLPPEGFPKLSEFWTTMGNAAWKPAIYLVAAVPVPLVEAFEFPAVTTMRTTTGQRVGGAQQIIYARDEDGYRSGTNQEWYQIGGVVTVSASLAPVKGARVTLQIAGNDTADPPIPPLMLQEARTDEIGRYQFLFAGPLPCVQRKFQVLVQKTGLRAPPLDVVLTPAEPFPHDVAMQSAVFGQ
ncbi:Pvc16 family protein [Zavarzinella formosa]|uniref:Pvc16 family protein n=1 Tax=Zavarzinella formosa TaxID=360055 RepID=UPI00037E456D|nr:Pvc16 family protein [Zavarzinella formosa]